MEERQAQVSWRKGLIALGFSVLAFSVSAKINATSMNPVSSSSVMYQHYALNTFVYNPKTLQWKAVKNGKVIRTGRGSAGRNYCPDVKRACRTPSGTYRIISKRGADCRSSRYPLGKGGAPMPYCMFFSKYYAIHGSPDVPNYNASHGCVRVKPHDARWLHQNFMHIGAKVVIKPY